MKYLKRYNQLLESDDTLQYMKIRYGKSTIEECESMIDDMKDMLLEFSDLGFDVTVGYSPLTLSMFEYTPKMYVNLSAIFDLFDKYLDEINELDLRLKDYVKSKGYSYGSNIWRPDVRKNYQILIQK
jgi:hypothetical protein